MGRSVDDLLREQDWAKVSARVLAYALSRTRSRAKASDVAQEAMMRALDARWNPWDPEKDPDIVAFLIKIVNRLLTNENQGRKRHRGLVFDMIACKPSRSYPASAKEISLDDRDVWGAIGRARVGARTFTEGGVVRREEGRPLLPWEVELVRLLDAGEERATARRNKRTKRIESLAVERLTPEEVLPKLRAYEDAPRTSRELKVAARAVRNAVRLELEDAQLIPSGGRAGRGDELPAMDEVSVAKRKKRRQTSPFPSKAAA